MKYILDNKQLDNLKKTIQLLIDIEIDSLKKESEEWGLGEMSELNELDAIKKIEVYKIIPEEKIIVIINIHTTTNKIYDFDIIFSEIEARVQNHLLPLEFSINKIIPNIN